MGSCGVAKALAMPRVLWLTAFANQYLSILYHKEDAIIMRICTECCYWCCVFQILNLTPLIVTILNQHHLLNHFHYIFNFLANILLKIQSFNQCTRTFQQICDKPNPYLYQEQAVICLYYLVGGQLNSTLIRLCL